MRIGLFTDTYYPATNGIVAVIDITKKRLEEAGHEVFVFCPDAKNYDYEDDENIIRYKSIPSGAFGENRISLFFPQIRLKEIEDLDLDVIHFFTPVQVGLMGVYAAERTDAVLVAQHSTDLYQYAQHYPQVLPGLLVLISTLPFMFKFDGYEIKTILSMYRPQLGAVKWNQSLIEKATALVYSRCDSVIALSRKSKKQLESWQVDNYHYDVELLPTGVDALPEVSDQEILDFQAQFGIEKDDEVFGYVGRLGAEKNLDILIRAFEKLARKRPQLKLMFVGDFDYREHLEEMAAEYSFEDRIIFTGKVPREKLNIAYKTLDVFVFPSLTDTQGLVIHEAALAGCPIVLIDRDLSEVVLDGENGYFARNNAIDLSRKIEAILNDPQLKKAFSKKSVELAKQYSEKTQVQKQIAIYEKLIEAKRQNDR